MDEIIINTQGENLDYTFHDPGKKSRDILIIGHGVTGNKDRPFVVALAEAVASEGMAVLRFPSQEMESPAAIFVIVPFPKRWKI